MDYRRCILGILSALTVVQVCTGQAFLENNFLVVADRSNGEIYQVNPKNGTVHHFPEISLSMPKSLVIHPYTGDIYVSDDDNNTIKRFSVANRTSTVIVDYGAGGFYSFGGLAIDPERELLYVARVNNVSYYSVIIELDLLSGQQLRRFNSFSNPCCSMELDHVSRTLYWTDSYRRGIVLLDLGDKNQINYYVLVPGIINPTALAADFLKRELYFVESDNGTIEKINLDGPPHRVVVHKDGTGHYYHGMTLDQEYIYFTDEEASNIRRINRKTHESSDFSGQVFNDLTGIGYFSRRNSTTTNTGSTTVSSSDATQPPPVLSCQNFQYNCLSGECAHVYSKCDGISDCSDASDESSDTCPSGTEPYLTSEYLVVAETTSGYLYQISISSGEVRRLPVKSTRDEYTSSKGLAIDPGTQDLYLLDAVASRKYDLKKFAWSTKNSSVIYTSFFGYATYQGIALNIEKELVYFSSSQYSQIGEWNISDGSYRVIQEEQKASVIVYDNNSGMLYWSSTDSTNPGIFKCSVAANDTQQPITGIITENISYPKAFDIDWKERKMYWTDESSPNTFLNNRIERANLDGSAREVLRREPGADFSYLAVTSNHVFFVNKPATSLRAFEKHSLDFHGYPQRRFQELYSVVSFDNSAVCMKDYQKCSDVGCVYKYHMCDGVNDCQDGSDELSALCPGGRKEYLEDNYLLVVDRSHRGIYQVNPMNGMVNHISELSHNLTKAMVIHPCTGDIYVSDEETNSIIRFSVADKMETTIIQFGSDENPETLSIDGLAIDPDMGLLYIGSVNLIIELNLTSLTEIRRFSFDLVKFSTCCSMEVDPVSRILYWADSTRKGISLLELDVKDSLPYLFIRGVGSPEVLAVDLSTRELYFSDSTKNTIERINLDGPLQRVVIHQDVTQRTYRGMTLDTKYIYFTDSTSSNIRRITRNTHESEDFLDQSFAELTAISYFSRRTPPTTVPPIDSTYMTNGTMETISNPTHSIPDANTSTITTTHIDDFKNSTQVTNSRVSVNTTTTLKTTAPTNTTVPQITASEASGGTQTSTGYTGTTESTTSKNKSNVAIIAAPVAVAGFGIIVLLLAAFFTR